MPSGFSVSALSLVPKKCRAAVGGSTYKDRCSKQKPAIGTLYAARTILIFWGRVVSRTNHKCQRAIGVPSVRSFANCSWKKILSSSLCPPRRLSATGTDVHANIWDVLRTLKSSNSIQAFQGLLDQVQMLCPAMPLVAVYRLMGPPSCFLPYAIMIWASSFP